MNEHSGAAITVQGLSHAYGKGDKKRLAVNNISFDVSPGEVLGFLGPNGAGKSTTIKVLTGQVPQQSGEVFILGMSRKGDRRALQARINVAFEEKNLYDDMTANSVLINE